MAAFRSRVHVKVVSGSRLVNLGFTAYDPRLARDAADGLSQLFIEWSLENRVAASKDATGWLSNQLREQQARIRTAERNLQEYQVESGLGNFEERLEMTEQELATLSAAVTQAQMGRVEKETLVTQLRGTSTTDMAAFPLVQSDPVVRDHREALSALRDERRRLSRELGHKHPRMIELASQIDTGEARLNTAIRDTSERLASQAETGRQQETELRQQLAAAEEGSQGLAQVAVEYRVLQRELESAQELFQSLLKRTQETGLESELRSTNVRLIEKARYPAAPFSPNRPRNYKLGLLIGLALGIGLSLLVENLDNTIKTPEDFKEAFDLPLVGVVPLVEVRPTIPTVQRLGSEAPQSAVAEAYRLLRTNLIFSAPGTEGRVLMVSSASPGEGKTTTVANIAASFAQNGAKVLALDADLRRPTLHQHFSIRKAPGLSDLIVGKSTPSEAVQVTRFKGLHVLPCGYVPPNPAELLGSRSMKEILAAFRDHYDWVLVDTAPILAMADTAVACPHADGLLLVVAAESTPRPAIGRAIDQILSVGGKVLGAVLNRVNLQRNAYYYSQYYGEYYRSYAAETAGTIRRDSSKIRRIDRSSA